MLIFISPCYLASAVMARSQSESMGTTRALITETEYEQLAGEHGDKRRYEATSRVRARVNQRLTEDIEHLAEYNPKLLGEIREVVCPEDEGPATGETADEAARRVRTLLKNPDAVDGRSVEVSSGNFIARSDDQGVTWVTTDMETLTAAIRNVLDERREADEGEGGDR